MDHGAPVIQNERLRGIVIHIDSNAVIILNIKAVIKVEVLFKIANDYKEFVSPPECFCPIL